MGLLIVVELPQNINQYKQVLNASAEIAQVNVSYPNAEFEMKNCVVLVS